MTKTVVFMFVASVVLLMASFALRLFIFKISEENEVLKNALAGCNVANFTSGFSSLFAVRSRLEGSVRAYVSVYLWAMLVGIALFTGSFLLLQTKGVSGN